MLFPGVAQAVLVYMHSLPLCRGKKSLFFLDIPFSCEMCSLLLKRLSFFKFLWWMRRKERGTPRVQQRELQNLNFFVRVTDGTFG